MKLDVLARTSAKASASTTFLGTVIVGNEETRARLERQLGRPVAMGEKFELGPIAVVGDDKANRRIFKKQSNSLFSTKAVNS